MEHMMTVAAGLTVAGLLYARVKQTAANNAKTLPPLSNPTNLLIRRPPAKTSAAFSHITSIRDLQRLAAQAKGARPPQGTSQIPVRALLPRTFVDATYLKDDLHATNNTIRVLQFNVLARGLSSPPNNGGFLLSPVDCLDFEHYRKYRLLEEILRFEPDIVTLEELDHYDDFFKPNARSFWVRQRLPAKIRCAGHWYLGQ